MDTEVQCKTLTPAERVEIQEAVQLHRLRRRELNQQIRTAVDRWLKKCFSGLSFGSKKK
ncbi:MAG: hypothetical protein WEC84_03330 [Candidatus Andersenbacteria bacterium]